MRYFIDFGMVPAIGRELDPRQFHRPRIFGRLQFEGFQNMERVD
jgi:hypothetical protein